MVSVSVPQRPPDEQWRVSKGVRESSKGLVSSQHYKASEAGARVLARGGNAIDAAVATSFMLATVEPWMSGLGGGGYMIVLRCGEERAQVVDFGMVSSKNLDPTDYPMTGIKGGDMFSWPAVLDDRNLKGFYSIALPTQVAGLALALDQFGSLPWSEILKPALDSAEQGMVVDWYSTVSIAAAAEDLVKDPTAASIYLPGGFPAAGQWGRRPPRIRLGNLPETLARLSVAGATDFYRGEIAEKILKDLSRSGCRLDSSDLSSYEAIIFEVSSHQYREANIYAAPRLTAGPTLLEVLKYLEGQCAFKGGVDAETYKYFARSISLANDHRLRQDGDVPNINSSTTSDCTSHISAVDSEGTVVALTQTLLSPFGSKVVLPETGILMNNAFMWFDPRPGVPNSIDGGKRPLSNMCPVIVENEIGCRIALGASGGRRILPAVLQIISFLVDNGMSFEEAMEQPRIDISAGKAVVVDTRLSNDIFAHIDQDFDASWESNCSYPSMFACPNLAAWDSQSNRAFGAAFITSPRASVACADDL